MSIFSAILEDNNLYMGGDNYSDCKWKEIDKPIKILFYYLNNGECIRLEGYDYLGHFVEATIDLNGINSGRCNICYAYLFTMREKIVTCYKIDIPNKKINILTFSTDDEFIKKLNPIIWKKCLN
jgi:hypothetical protein